MSLLSEITINNFTVKDTFSFTSEIIDQDAQLFMGSLDVDSLFTNVPLEDTVNICSDQLFKNVDKVNNLSKEEFKQLLSLATKESYFMFDNECYQQIDGVAMGSPLGPTLANAFFNLP